MKSRYNWLSYALMSLPALFLLVGWNRIPDPVAIQGTEPGEAEKVTSRQEWLVHFACIAILLMLTHHILFLLLRSYTRQHRGRFLLFYWLSAGFVCALTGLYVTEGMYQTAVYAYTFPILMALGEAGLIYSIMPDQLPVRFTSTSLTAQQMRASGHIYTIARFLLIWVNILVGLMMLFAPGADRWQMGVTANLLICLTILLMGAIAAFQANQLN